MSAHLTPPPPPPPAYAPPAPVAPVAVAPESASALPAMLLFTHVHGFIDEETGLQYYKLEGATETNPNMIRKLMERGGPFLSDPAQIQHWQWMSARQGEYKRYYAAVGRNPKLHDLIPPPDGYDAWKRQNNLV